MLDASCQGKLPERPIFTKSQRVTWRLTSFRRIQRPSREVHSTATPEHVTCCRHRDLLPQAPRSQSDHSTDAGRVGRAQPPRPAWTPAAQLRRWWCRLRLRGEGLSGSSCAQTEQARRNIVLLRKKARRYIALDGAAQDLRHG